jgi:predicted dehydrogenase
MDLAWGFPTWEVEIVGTSGALRTTQTAFQTYLFAHDGPAVSYRNQNELHFEELRSWATMCIKGEQSPYLPTAQEAYDAMELCLAARESARSKKAIGLESFRSTST